MNAIKVKEFGLDVIYRHDYDIDEQGANISKYVNQSCCALEKFLKNIPYKLDSLLDVGCANTQIIDFFENRGYFSRGIDLYPQRESDKIYAKDFYTMSGWLPQRWDIITINHTLEHSLAPLLMEQVRQVHNIGGVLFIAVPDADYPWAYELTSSTTHWSIFNEGFLRVLLQRYGYEVCIEKKCFRENCGELFAYGIKRW